MPAKATTTLAEALLALQADLPRVHKGQTARVETRSGGEYSYTYADLGAVTDAVLPLLNKCGLSFVVTPRRAQQGDYEIVGQLVHTSGQTIEASLPLVGRSPQEIGSALTYARRYLLGCMTGVVTDDDDDAKEVHTQQRTQGTNQPAAQANDELLKAQELVAAAWEQGGHGKFDLRAAADMWHTKWSEANVPLDQGSVTQLQQFAAWLTTEGKNNGQ